MRDKVLTFRGGFPAELHGIVNVSMLVNLSNDSEESKITSRNLNELDSN